MVKLLAKQVYDGVITQKVLEQFTDLVKRSFASHINDVMSERLNIAIQTTENREVSQNKAIEANTEQVQEDSKIVTTEEEIEAYYIVKSILRNHIQAERVTYRDAQSYFAIFCDDNNRKPICRLYFNTANKYIGIFDADKKETKHRIETLDDIYNHQEELINSVKRYTEE